VVVVWARPMHAEVVWGRWIWVAAAATPRLDPAAVMSAVNFALR